MSFKSSLSLSIVLSLLSASSVYAAEWKVEPAVGLRTQYNDNVRLRSEDNNPQGSTGYTLDPRVVLSGEEQQLWNVSLDTRGKLTRYQDIENSDSNNIFVAFGAGYNTERLMWSLNANIDRNTSLDTDFDTASPDAGLFDDKTERKTVSIAPSVRWNLGETSAMIFSIQSTSVSFDEVRYSNLIDYDNDKVSLQIYWNVSDNHSLGFTTSYTEQDAPDVGFSSDTTVINLDYTYTQSLVSSWKVSLGGRKLNSLRKDGEFLGCENPGEFEALGTCLYSPPVFGDLESQDNGAVVNVSYSYDGERASQYFNASKNVVSSSTGGVQEVQSSSYSLDFKNTQRFSTRLNISGSKSVTISGADSSIDVTSYRFEPSISYKLDKNWNLSFLYRHIKQNRIDSDVDSTSNAVYVNLYLNWPKLATTY